MTPSRTNTTRKKARLVEQVVLTGRRTELHPTPDELHEPELQTADPDLAALDQLHDLVGLGTEWQTSDRRAELEQP